MPLEFVRRGADGASAQPIQQRHGHDRQKTGHHFPEAGPVCADVPVGHRRQRHHHPVVVDHRLRHCFCLLRSAEDLPHFGQVNLLFVIHQLILYVYTLFQRAAAIGESDEGTGRDSPDRNAQWPVDLTSLRSAASFLADHVRTAGYAHRHRPGPQFYQQVARIRCGNKHRPLMLCLLHISDNHQSK